HLFDRGVASSGPASPVTLDTLRTTLTSQADTTVASRLGVSLQTVQNTVASICQDLGGTQLVDPVEVIRQTFPNAMLKDLVGLNGLIWLALDRCTNAGTF